MANISYYKSARVLAALSLFDHRFMVTAADCAASDRSGCAVVLSVDILLVGMYEANGNTINCGATYIFERNAEWEHSFTLSPIVAS